MFLSIPVVLQVPGPVPKGRDARIPVNDLEKAGASSSNIAYLKDKVLRSATRSRLKEFVSFARGISEDYEAVRNALTFGWSNGQLEG